MIRNQLLYVTVLVCFVGVGCVRKEIPVKPHESGNVTTAMVNMDATYKYQVYYSLKTNAVVGKNLKTSWDLGFEEKAGGYHVVLNAAKSMFVMNTGKADFASVAASDTAGFSLHKKWDGSDGSMDSTAVGDWRIGKDVYIMDLGFNEAGQWLGMRKVQFLGVDSLGYTVRFAMLNGSGDTTVPVAKDSTFNLAFLSFTSRGQLQVEPPKITWDLEFTQYTYTFYDETPPIPYLVTGCILNRNGTTAAVDTTTAFTNIAFTNINSYTFSAGISTVGYDWKTFNGTSYTVNPAKTYIIKDVDGLYYKMHFIGFYNNSGTKGNPQWEFQKL